MIRKLFLIACLMILNGCVSYYQEYESDYYASGYSSYYNSPLRLRGLSYNDFYMLDNYPQDYFDMQLWSAVTNVTHFSIVSIFRCFR